MPDNSLNQRLSDYLLQKTKQQLDEMGRSDLYQKIEKELFPEKDQNPPPSNESASNLY